MNHQLSFLAAVIVFLCSPEFVRAAGSNLVVNGSFSNTNEPLQGWKSVYNLDGEGWYNGNAQYVSVLERQGGRNGVLRLHVATQFLADNPGVKVDSKPIPFDPAGKYEFSAWACAAGPNARIMLEGYKWQPGIKPHPDPELHELRRVYKFELLSFKKSGERTSGFSEPGREWRKGTMSFPGEIRSDLMKSKLEEIRFIVVHIVGIGGHAGDVFVDDVEIRRRN